MGELAAVAERLRMVKTAQRRFLGLWALDCLLEGATERFCGELATILADDEEGRDDLQMDGLDEGG